MSSPLFETPAPVRVRIEPILRALEDGRAAHAYLLLGSPIGGREEAARELAAAHLCPTPGPGACGECRSCRAVAAGSHPDLVLVTPVSRTRQILIEQIRDLEIRLQRKPVWGDRRAGVVFEADMMTLQAANAFLKTLEEPSGGTLLVLTAESTQGLVETVVSRCQRVSMGDAAVPRPEWAAEVESALASMYEGEASAAACRQRVYSALGRILALLESLRAASKVEAELPDDMDPAAKRRLTQEAEARSLSRYVAERRRLVESLAVWWRDVLAVTLGAGESLGLEGDRLARIERVAACLTPQDAEHRLAAVHQLQQDLDRNVQETLAMERCLLRLGRDGT